MKVVDVPVTIQRHKSVVIAAGVVAPLIACTVLSLFRDSINSATAVLVLVLIVIAAASTGLRAAGIAAALSSGVWFDLFLTQPYGRLVIDDPDDVETTILLVVIGAAVTEVALWGYRQQGRANRRTGYLDGVLETAEIVTLRHDAPEALIGHVAEQIREVLDVGRCRFVPGRVHDARYALFDHQGRVTRGGRDVDVDRDGLPIDEETALLVQRAGVTLGHFLITASGSVARPTIEARKVAVLLADQAGLALADPAR